MAERAVGASACLLLVRGAVVAHATGVRTAEARRRRAVVAPERLRELGGLPVADGVGDVAHRQRALAQELERAAHADLGHVRAEAGVAYLGEGALELAPRRREPPRDLVELDRMGVL